MAKGDRSKALGQFIQAQRRLAHLSLRELSKLAKVSNPYLSQIERGIYEPSAQVLKGIAEALHIPAEAMFARVGLLDEEGPEGSEPFTVEDAVRLDERLTPDQKETLLSVYRSFVTSR
jgi:transcriptional regulator with XRE-family HTH domain